MLASGAAPQLQARTDGACRMTLEGRDRLPAVEV